MTSTIVGFLLVFIAGVNLTLMLAIYEEFGKLDSGLLFTAYSLQPLGIVAILGYAKRPDLGFVAFLIGIFIAIKEFRKLKTLPDKDDDKIQE